MRPVVVRIWILLASVLMGTQGIAATFPHHHQADDPCFLCLTPNSHRRKRVAEAAKREDRQGTDPSITESVLRQAQPQQAPAAIRIEIPDLTSTEVRVVIPGPLDANCCQPLCDLCSPRAPPYARCR